MCVQLLNVSCTRGMMDRYVNMNARSQFPFHMGYASDDCFDAMDPFQKAGRQNAAEAWAKAEKMQKQAEEAVLRSAQAVTTTWAPRSCHEVASICCLMYHGACGICALPY